MSAKIDNSNWKTLLAVAAELLELAAADFANHGCGDFLLPSDVPHVQLIQDAQQHMYGDRYPVIVSHDDPTKVVTEDALLMRYCAHLLRQRVAEEGSGAHAARPSPSAELVVTEHAGALLRISVVSADAAAWVDQVAPAYAEYYRVAEHQRSLVVLPNFDPAAIAAYLRSYGASPEKEST